MAKKRAKSNKKAQSQKNPPQKTPRQPDNRAFNPLSDFERMEARFGAFKPPEAPPTASTAQAPQSSAGGASRTASQTSARHASQEAPPNPQQNSQQTVKKRKRRYPWQKRKSAQAPDNTRKKRKPLFKPRKRKPLTPEQQKKAERKAERKEARRNRKSWFAKRRARLYTPAQRRAQTRNRVVLMRKLGKWLTVLLTLFCMLLAVVQFFTVREIRFEGVTRYTTAQVTQSFGVEIGDNLFLADTTSGVKALTAAYPYFQQITVTRELPQTLVVTVKEATPAAAVVCEGGGWYLIDSQARVLEKTTSEYGIANVPVIDGVEAPDNVALGEEIPADDAGRIAKLREVMDELTELGLVERVGRINLNAMYDICFELDGIYAVRIGDGTDLANKLRWIDVLTENYVGATDLAVFDLTDTTQATVMEITQEQLDALLESSGETEDTLVTPNQLMGIEEELSEEEALAEGESSEEDTETAE